jgi:adenylate cyclase
MAGIYTALARLPILRDTTLESAEADVEDAKPVSRPGANEEPMVDGPTEEARWRGVLLGDESKAPGLYRLRRIFKHLPSDPRCKLCFAPYAPPFGPLVAMFGYGPWNKNPSLCGGCLRIMERAHGGAEVELSMLFADLRRSTELAATMSPYSYTRLLNRFYAIASRAIEENGGTVDKYLGDGIFALFIPGFAGPDHAARAVDAASRILRETSGAADAPPEVTGLPVGIGVHTGTAYVGVVGHAGDLTDFTALGDAVNLTQRLSSAAGESELLISEAALAAARLPTEGLERRELELKGVAAPVPAWSRRVQPIATRSA